MHLSVSPLYLLQENMSFVDRSCISSHTLPNKAAVFLFRAPQMNLQVYSVPYSNRQKDENRGRMRRGRHCTRARVVVFSLVAALCILIYSNFLRLSYLLRPVWDRPPQPFTFIPHYYAENLSLARMCELHGWKLRDRPRRLFDAVMFSNELDLLEIRWKEIYPHVTKLVLLEANGTFTGLPKPLFFAKNSHRFAFAASKLAYCMTPTRPLSKSESPFLMELYQRQQMDRVLVAAGIQQDDVLLMSDVDEIPSAHTLKLLRWCHGFPPIMHLQMRNYVYSFEFPMDDRAWRASMHLFQPGKTKYGHFRRSAAILADAGWHCSFCFRHISEIIFKMKAYSHADRLPDTSYLNPVRIQDAICKGKDLFDLLPEEYTFKELIGKMGDVPSSYSGVHLPLYLLENAHKFKFLLPGNCFREPDP